MAHKIQIPDVQTMASGDLFTQTRELHTILVQLNAHIESQDERIKRLEAMLVTRDEDVPNRPKAQDGKAKSNASA